MTGGQIRICGRSPGGRMAGWKASSRWLWNLGMTWRQRIRCPGARVCRRVSRGHFSFRRHSSRRRCHGRCSTALDLPLAVDAIQLVRHHQHRFRPGFGAKLRRRGRRVATLVHVNDVYLESLEVQVRAFAEVGPQRRLDLGRVAGASKQERYRCQKSRVSVGHDSFSIRRAVYEGRVGR